MNVKDKCLDEQPKVRPGKATLNFWVDLVTAVLFCTLLGTAALMKWVLPPGTCDEPGVKVWLGHARHWWGDIHFWAAMALLALLIVHIWLHWKWVTCFWGKLLGSLKSPATWGVVLLMGALIAVPFAIPPGYLEVPVEDEAAPLLAGEVAPCGVAGLSCADCPAAADRLFGGSSCASQGTAAEPAAANELMDPGLPGGTGGVGAAAGCPSLAPGAPCPSSAGGATSGACATCPLSGACAGRGGEAAAASEPATAESTARGESEKPAAGTGASARAPDPPAAPADAVAQVCPGACASCPSRGACPSGTTALETPAAASGGGIGERLSGEARLAADEAREATAAAAMAQGQSLWRFYACGGCHESGMQGRTAAELDRALTDVPQMSGVSLSGGELAALAAYLQGGCP